MHTFLLFNFFIKFLSQLVTFSYIFFINYVDFYAKFMSWVSWLHFKQIMANNCYFFNELSLVIMRKKNMDLFFEILANT